MLSDNITLSLSNNTAGAVADFMKFSKEEPQGELSSADNREEIVIGSSREIVVNSNTDIHGYVVMIKSVLAIYNSKPARITSNNYVDIE